MKVKSRILHYLVLSGGMMLSAAIYADDALQPYWASATSPSSASTPDILIPTEQFPLFNSASQEKQLLSLKWEHQPVGGHSLRFSAGYGDDVYLEEMPYDSVSTMAELAWTGQGAGRFQPSGSVFVGDADTRDEIYQHLDRKYVGFSVGGRVTAFEKHSPYISFRMLRTSYDEDVLDDPLVTPSEISRLTAGWDWQVGPNWRLRAEADFTLEDEFSLDLDRYDPSRVFFSTRFDFR